MSKLFNFDELRAKRNAAVQERHKKLEAEYGVSLHSTFNPDACYCACGSDPRGTCEHKWDGPDWESTDGCCMSVTCSRCGTTAMSHDLRNGP
jgi:hypothetical protein